MMVVEVVVKERIRHLKERMGWGREDDERTQLDHSQIWPRWQPRNPRQTEAGCSLVTIRLTDGFECSSATLGTDLKAVLDLEWLPNFTSINTTLTPLDDRLRVSLLLLQPPEDFLPCVDYHQWTDWKLDVSCVRELKSQMHLWVALTMTNYVSVGCSISLSRSLWLVY